MNIVEKFCTKSECYQANVKKYDSRYTNFKPKGLMLHSVGCNQPSAEVFYKIWNNFNSNVVAHAVLQADGTVIQCLPWDFRGWHGGGSSNNTHIGVEMTEPDSLKYLGGAKFACTDKANAVKQVEGTYNTAVELFAFLCEKYNLNPLKDIVSHSEGYKKGIASGHADPEHLWGQLGLSYTMDTFRSDVKKLMTKNKETPKTPAKAKVSYYVRKAWADKKTQLGAFKNLENAKKLVDKNKDYKVYDTKGNVVYPGTFTVQVTTTDIPIHKGAGVSFNKVGNCPIGVFTILETKTSGGSTWGRLKSGVGWIPLDKVEKL